MNLRDKVVGEGYIIKPCPLACDVLCGKLRSICVNHLSGSAGQKGDSLMGTAHGKYKPCYEDLQGECMAHQG